ncbi:MAG: 50S ribosomal protein L10 [Deltaproteobacteria bacterium]|nr:50S ribosomal protein L10 [Deltaproteobacteria bacterium]
MGRKETRKLKAEIIEELREKAARAQIGVLADFTGLNVEAMSQLRRQLKEADGELKVAKNTLLRRSATDNTLLAPLVDQFVGPNALALGYTDPVPLAKLLVKFAQEKPVFKIKAGVLGGQVLSPADIEALAKLPSKEVLQAQLLGAMQAVPAALVTVLTGVIRNFLNVLVALKDQKDGGEGAAEARIRWLSLVPRSLRPCPT